jgi:predicted nuclease with TOPRIM domain
MKRGVEKLPAQTEDAKARTEALLKENSGLEEEISGYDDYDQIKESKESWERLRTKIEQSESATE